MLNHILQIIKDQKDYEAKLKECSKPIKFITDIIDKYLDDLNEAKDKMDKKIYEYFSWTTYYGYMVSEVLIPLMRVYFYIQRKRGYPSLIPKDGNTEGQIPCTYSEAYAFFKELSHEDAKAFLRRLFSPLDYVNLIDCIEKSDSVRFTTILSKVDDVEAKLCIINSARMFLPFFVFDNDVLGALAKQDFQQLDKIFESEEMESIASAYNWDTISGIRDFMEAYLNTVLTNSSEFLNELDSNPTIKRYYECLFVPCLRAFDFRNPDEISNAISICADWSSSPTFVRFWRDLANIAYSIIFNLINEKFLLFSKKEQEVLESIVATSSKISPLRLGAVIQCDYFKICDDVVESVESTPAICIESNADKNRSNGQPYYEAAQDRELIELQAPDQSAAESISFSLPENFFIQKKNSGSFHMDLRQEIISVGVKKFETFLNALSDYGYISRGDLPLLAYRLTGCGEHPFGEEQIIWHEEPRVIRYVISKFHAPGANYASRLDKYFIEPQGNTFLRSIKAGYARNIKKLPIFKEVIMPLYGDIIE